MPNRPSRRQDYRSRIYGAYASRGQRRELGADAEATARRSRYLRRALQGWLPEHRDASIADLGCGAGEVLAAFESFGYTSLTGVDHSPEQVRLAREIAPQVVAGDLFDYLEGREAEFDLITGFDVIEHLRKDEVLACLDACHLALKPGGRLVLQTPNAESPWASAIRYGDFTHEVCFTPGSLEWLLRLCGFAGVEAREAGPRPIGLLSMGRVLLWRSIRMMLAIWNLAETGSAGSGVYTRVFLMSAVKASTD